MGFCMKKIRFDQFCNFMKIVDTKYHFSGTCHDPQKDLRLGQYAMIILSEINKEIYHYITGTKFDPFYDNKKINVFLAHLLENYVERPL